MIKIRSGWASRALAVALALSLPNGGWAAVAVEAARAPGRAVVPAVSLAPAAALGGLDVGSALGAAPGLRAPAAELPALGAPVENAPSLIEASAPASPVPAAIEPVAAGPSLSPLVAPRAASIGRASPQPASAQSAFDDSSGREPKRAFQALSLPLPAFSRMGESEASAAAAADFAARLGQEPAGPEQALAALAPTVAARSPLSASAATTSEPKRAVPGIGRWRAVAARAAGWAPFTAALAMVTHAIGALSPMAIGAAFMAVMIPSFILHEMGHGKVADKLGDPTPRLEGRLSWKPKDLLTHIDPVTTIVLPITTLILSVKLLGAPIILAGARQLGFVPHYLASLDGARSESKGTALVALAGPGVHLAIALGLAALHLGLVAAGLGGPASWVALALFFNVLYMVFNLIPLAPLDGHHVARWVVAEPLRRPRLAEWLFGPLVPPAKGLLVVLRDPGALRGGLDAWDRSLAASNAPLSRELEEDLAAAGLDPEILRTFGARVAAADPELNAVFLQLPPKAKGRNEELETALTKLGFNFYQATWGGFRAVRADFEARRESPVVRGFSAPFEQAARSAVHFYILAVTLLLLSSYLLAAVQAVSALLLSGSGALAGAP